MTVELKNDTPEIKELLSLLDILPRNEVVRVKDYVQGIRERYLNTQKKEANKKNKWAKLAEEMHEKSPLDGVSEEANKLFKQFREESSF